MWPLQDFPFLCQVDLSAHAQVNRLRADDEASANRVPLTPWSGFEPPTSVANISRVLRGDNRAELVRLRWTLVASSSSATADDASRATRTHRGDDRPCC
jgi:hypothetical protein